MYCGSSHLLFLQEVEQIAQASLRLCVLGQGYTRKDSILTAIECNNSALGIALVSIQFIGSRQENLDLSQGRWNGHAHH